MDLIDKSVEKSSGFAKCFGKMAKAHAKCAKAHESLAGHHSDLHKAAIALGDEEEAIDMQGDEEDESRAHTGGSSEKTAAEQADKLQKAAKDGDLAKAITALSELVKGLGTKVDDQNKKIDDVKKTVDDKLNELEPGPAEAAKKAAEAAKKAGGQVAIDDKHGKTKEEQEKGNALSVSKVAAKGVGVFK